MSPPSRPRSGAGRASRGAEYSPLVSTGSTPVERKLAAILAADVVGYSRLVESDEEETVRVLRSYRSIVEDLVVAHHGRVFGGAGDSVVAEFSSAVEAVRCALDIQLEVQRRNADAPVDRRMTFRIGVNLGDVVVDGDDLLGDGVNVAARLEALSPEGGFCVSQAIYDQLRGKVEIRFEDAGEHEVKNLSRPVRVWRWVPEVRRLDRTVPNAARGPSIAVLPFVNMSGEAEQEYFSDGMAEDIITDLSKVSGLFVAARNSSFLYKGGMVRPDLVGAELGVGHVLEGSVRKAGGRVRITAQLIDCETGGHLWAERYDSDLTDVFAVQDEITNRIVESLRITLLPQEKEAIGRVPTENVEAYEAYLLGRQFFRRHARTNYTVAKRMFQRAIDLDPRYARAYAGVADCDSFVYLAYRRSELVDSILEASAKAIELDDALAEAHASRGLALSTVGRVDEADAEFARAIELDPGLYEAHYFFARACYSQGRKAEAAAAFRSAAEVVPDDFEANLFLMQCLGDLGDEAGAAAAGREGFANAERQLIEHPENVRAAYLGANYLAGIGEEDRAREWVSLALLVDPDDFLVQYNSACVFAQLGDHEEALDLLEQALPKANVEFVQNWVSNDSDLDSLRDNPRFIRLIESLTA
jgi:adenylate cyclase